MKTFLATTGNGIARAEPQDEHTWKVSHLLAGQRVFCLAADPHEQGAIFAGTESSGVLRSADGGRTWVPAGLADQNVKAIQVSPILPGTVYAGTKPAMIFVSRDHGQNWQELPAFRQIPSRRFWFSPAEKPHHAYIQGIALSPTDEDLILAGIEAGAVVRSSDGGQTWEDHRKGALRDCHSITFHHSLGNWAYEGGGTGAGNAFSQDGGETWTQNRAEKRLTYGWACAADPLDPRIFYFSVSPSPMKAHSQDAARAYIFRSEAGGNWVKLGGGLPQPLKHMPYALLTDPAAPGHLYAGLSNGDVWHTPDHGNTWRRLPLNLGIIHRVMIML